MKKKSVHILDCTLRDGSYAIDYQFTAEDTYIICLGLEKAGFKLIEVGHGTGLRSSLVGKGKAAATDEEYLQAARTALSGSDARFGMFFIPGIGKIEDLEMAAEYGMGFVRIGTNVTEIDQAKPYIEKAKTLGMTVSSNLMKSYAVSIDDFIKLAKMADDYGVDVISVVDSAGGMFPDDVREYVSRLRDVTDKKIGFHGHNNLQLAVANSLQAVKAGASIVDSSLQGMGRSAGNTQTEILALALEKMGYQTGVDPYRTLDLGVRIIKPMMSREQGIDDLSVVSGIAQFHSSFSKIVNEAAQKFSVDPRMLIMEVSEVNRVSVTKELAEETAEKIAKRMQNRKGKLDLSTVSSFPCRKAVGNNREKLESIISEIISLSKKTGKDSVFSITLSREGKTTFPFVRKSSSMIIGNCEASGNKETISFIQYLDGKVDWILLDQNCPDLFQSGFEKKINKSSFAWYSEDRSLILSTLSLLLQRCDKGKVLIFSDPDTAAIMTLFMKRHGMVGVFQADNGAYKIKDRQYFNEIGAIVSFGRKYSEFLDAQHVDFLKEGTDIYLARPDAFPLLFWEAAIAKGLSAYRIDSRVGFAAELNLVVETRKLIGSTGSTKIAGIPVVSGGFIGYRGSVVVDSIVNPTKVIGIANGLGGLLPEEEYHIYNDSLEKIRGLFLEKLYQ